MREFIRKVLLFLLPIFWMGTTCAVIIHFNWDIFQLLIDGAGFRFLILLILVYCLGYATSKAFFNYDVVRLKRWSPILGYIFFFLVETIRIYFFSDTPIITTVGWYMTSVIMRPLLIFIK